MWHPLQRAWAKRGVPPLSHLAVQLQLSRQTPHWDRGLKWGRCVSSAAFLPNQHSRASLLCSDMIPERLKFATMWNWWKVVNFSLGQMLSEVSSGLSWHPQHKAGSLWQFTSLRNGNDVCVLCERWQPRQVLSRCNSWYSCYANSFQHAEHEVWDMYEQGHGLVYYSSFVGFMFFPLSVGAAKELPGPWYCLYLSLSSGCCLWHGLSQDSPGVGISSASAFGDGVCLAV